MGASISQSRGSESLEKDDLLRMFELPDGVWLINSGRYRSDALSGYSYLDDAQRLAARQALQEGISVQCDRSIGCLLGLLVGDALGAPLEFHPVRFPRKEATSREIKSRSRKPSQDAGSHESEQPEARDSGFSAGFDPALWADKSDLRETNRFMLEMGQWTDDTAMALCLADSLLQHRGFHPRDLRLRFLAWWTLGYNNAFGRDNRRAAVWGSAESIGLGGIIGESLKEFSRIPADYTKTGSIRSSGNGSIMRNAPVAIMYRNDIKSALEVAWRQSKTTHQGDEAADCARLLTWICIRAMSEGKAVLKHLGEFDAKLYSTKCLAESVQEERHEENKGMDLDERNWNWRHESWQYAAARVAEQPGYAGSYCMDCLAMALHCVHWTTSFEAALLSAANLCGDADTVAAVTGQIAGAIYGASAIPTRWQHVVERWDAEDTRVRAWLLYVTEPSGNVTENEQSDGKKWTQLQEAEPEEVEPMCSLSSPSPMPFACTACNRRFGNATLRDMHVQRCGVASGMMAR
eukprot:TRINITY_DN39069_c0_g1_i1.p1 TRINITY_DN39069_c0_g1~~TRINITY_DN39069_c0_g1_i1.p1  ORF type:complete len:547 (-),score=74.80 TRINITY_DN39069_c0_g1_i1:120-1679(-)